MALFLLVVKQLVTRRLLLAERTGDRQFRHRLLDDKVSRALAQADRAAALRTGGLGVLDAAIGRQLQETTDAEQMTVGTLQQRFITFQIPRNGSDVF